MRIGCTTAGNENATVSQYFWTALALHRNSICRVRESFRICFLMISGGVRTSFHSPFFHVHSPHLLIVYIVCTAQAVVHLLLPSEVRFHFNVLVVRCSMGQACNVCCITTTTTNQLLSVVLISHFCSVSPLGRD